MKKVLLFLLLVTAVLSAETIKITSVEQFNKVVKKAQPGDSLILANGEWKDAVLKFSCSGTEDKNITLLAETPGKVILIGASQLKIGGDYLKVDGLYFKNGYIESGSVIEFRRNSDQNANYSRLTNTRIEDYNPLDKNKDYKWISVYGKYNRVDHCYARNKVHSGCLLVVWLSKEPNYAQVDSNYFAFRPELGYNGAEIIRIGTSDWSMYPSKTVVEYNYFEDCNGEREIISNKSHDNIFRHNTFVRCKGTLTLRHGNNALVEGNFFFGEHVEGTGGIRIIGENHTVINNYITGIEGDEVFAPICFMNGVPNSPLNRYFQVKNALVAFNTLIDNKSGMAIGASADTELTLIPINSVIANNIIAKTKKPFTFIATPENFTWEGNIFPSENDKISGKYNYFLEPDLSVDNNIYRLTANSFAVNTSSGKYEKIMRDFDGQLRQGKKDIGCDEFSEEKIFIIPMNQKNTGPNWK